MAKNSYIKIVRTADLVAAGYAHLTSGCTLYTFVNSSWIKTEDKL